ncbi:MAG: histidinol dehydrogenase [Candidatus Bathyarchaeia archaeon]
MPLRVLRLGEARELALASRWPRRRGLDRSLLNYAEEIIERVKREGDKALIELTERFDGVRLSRERLKVGREEIEEAYEMVSGDQISAIKLARERIERFERNILEHAQFEYVDALGIRIRREYRPIGSVGCYVPGGMAAYPSTLVMATVPAKAAGVGRVTICTPPRRDGSVNPLTLVAADVCGVDEIYRVGGIQAIAALAYGTETIKPVEKIVGPGNRYVLAAKVAVSRDVPIDHPAGPSEIMILASEDANPHYIALDMISQAEHDPNSIAILITTSISVAESTLDYIMRLIGQVTNGDRVRDALEENGLILIAESMDEAINFVNDFAPEHLEIMAEDPYSISKRIYSAGLILIGEYTPVSLSDYCIGTNHILPTSGFSHVYQSLSALDFVRFVNIVECTRDALIKLLPAAKTLAESEGLPNHALAIEGRLKG